MPEIKNETSNTEVSDDSTASTETPSYLTAEQFNRALTNKEKAFEKRLAKQQEEFQQMLKSFVPAPKEEPALSRTAELEKTVRELSKNLQDRDARDKNTALRKTTEQTLRSNGINPEFTDHALAYLIDAKQAIKYDNGGNIIMVLNGMEYEDLNEGIAVWAQSSDAKLYKKPSGAQGTGDNNRRSNTGPVLNKNGKLDLKTVESKAKNFNPLAPKSSLDKTSRAALEQVLIQKLKQQ